MKPFRFATLLACSALAVPAVAQEEGKPFKHALPAGTLAFFSAPDLDTSIGEFQKTALAKMWREEEVQDFVADAMKMGQQKWKEGIAQLREMNEAGKFPMSPDELLKLRMNSVSIALTSAKIQMGEFQPEPRIGVIAHMDFGESAKTWQKLVLLGIDALLAEADGEFERSEKALEGGAKLITLTPPMTDMSINCAFVGNGMVIGSLQSEVAACVEAMSAHKTILPNTPDYRATAKYTDAAGAEMEAYIHVSGLVDFVMDALKFAEKEAPDWPEELQVDGIERAMTALGMRSMRAIGMTSKYEGSKTVTRSFALAPEGGRKGVFAAGGEKLDLSFLKWVPQDVASLTASKMNMSSVYDSLVNAVKAYNPDVADQLLGMLKQHEEQAGINLKDDLFDVFGDQMVWWSMGVQNFMSAPEGALLIKVKDQDKLLATLQKVAGMTGGMVEFPSSERKGIKTWRLELNPDAIDPQVATALSFLQPCFAFKNGYMVTALATGDVRKAFKRMERDDDPKGDIRGNKEFAGYLAQVQQMNISSFGWTDWKASFENMYQAATSVLAFAVSADEIPFDLTLLPEAETLSQHLYSSAIWSTQNKDGYRSTSISPIGPEIVVGGLAVGLGAAGVFGMTTARRAPVMVEAAPADEAKPVKKKDK